MGTSVKNLFYAIGELAYAIASADGAIQKEERQKFHDLVAGELRSNNYNFDLSLLIFQIMDKDKVSTENAYQSALKRIVLNQIHLNAEMKNSFIRVMEKMMEAYPPVTPDEIGLLERFKKDIEPLKSDSGMA